jgi:hypothetical protein
VPPPRFPPRHGIGQQRIAGVENIVGEQHGIIERHVEARVQRFDGLDRRGFRPAQTAAHRPGQQPARSRHGDAGRHRQHEGVPDRRLGAQPAIDQRHAGIGHRERDQERPQRHAHHAGRQHSGFGQHRHGAQDDHGPDAKPVGQPMRPSEILLAHEAPQPRPVRAGPERIAEQAAQRQAEPDRPRSAPETQHRTGRHADQTGGNRQQDIRHQGGDDQRGDGGRRQGCRQPPVDPIRDRLFEGGEQRDDHRHDRGDNGNPPHRAACTGHRHLPQPPDRNRTHLSCIISDNSSLFYEYPTHEVRKR